MITHERHHRKEPCQTCVGSGYLFRYMPESPPCPDCHDPDHYCTDHKVIHDGHCAQCVAEQNEAMWDDYKCRV